MSRTSVLNSLIDPRGEFIFTYDRRNVVILGYRNILFNKPMLKGYFEDNITAILIDRDTKIIEQGELLCTEFIYKKVYF